MYPGEGVGQYWCKKSKKKQKGGQCIYHSSVYIQACKGVYQEFNIGGGKIGIAKHNPDPPVPFSEWAVTESIPDAQDKPWKDSTQQCDEIEKPGFFPYPAEKVECDNEGVENKKESIKKDIHGNWSEDLIGPMRSLPHQKAITFSSVLGNNMPYYAEYISHRASCVCLWK